MFLEDSGGQYTACTSPEGLKVLLSFETLCPVKRFAKGRSIAKHLFLAPSEYSQALHRGSFQKKVDPGPSGHMMLPQVGRALAGSCKLVCRSIWIHPSNISPIATSNWNIDLDISLVSQSIRLRHRNIYVSPQSAAMNQWITVNASDTRRTGLAAATAYPRSAGYTTVALQDSSLRASRSSSVFDADPVSKVEITRVSSLKPAV